MSGEYAKTTSVSTDKSRAEIERTLLRYGADQFAYGIDRSAALVGFRIAGRQVRIVIELPDRNADEFQRSPARRTRRTPQQAEAAWEQACRQRWRALLLVIKAKLEAVDSGIATLEDEFLAYTVLPDGGTVGEHVREPVAAAIAAGSVPSLLPQLGA